MTAGKVRIVSAELVTVSNVVVGYRANPRDNLSDQRFSQLEMKGRHLKNVMTALVHIRRRTDARIDTGPWTYVAAEAAAAIKPPPITVQAVANLCVAIGFEADKGSLPDATARAMAARDMPGFRLMPAKTIGKLLELTGTEAALVKSLLKCKRLGVTSIDAADARERDRLRKAQARAREGAIPRNKSKAAMAREMGIPRHQLYPRASRRKGAATDSSGLPYRGVMRTKVSPHPGNADETVADNYAERRKNMPSMGNADETVAGGENDA